MALENPFPLYGIITDAGAPVNGANVYCTSKDFATDTITMTTGADGKYVLEMMGIGISGDYSVWAFAPDGKYKKDSFELITTDQSQRMNLALEYYPLSDTILAPTESLTKNFSKVLADTSPAVTENLTKNFSKTLADTSPAATDSLTKEPNIALSDNINAITETLTKDFSKTLSDTINTPTDVLIKSFNKILTDSILAPTETCVLHFNKSISDAIAAATDALTTFLTQVPFYLRLYSTNEQKQTLSSTNEQKYMGYSNNEQKFVIKKED